MLSMFLKVEGVFLLAIRNRTCGVPLRMSATRRKKGQMRKFWAPISLQGSTQKCLSCLLLKHYSCQPIWTTLRWPLSLRRYFSHHLFCKIQISLFFRNVQYSNEYLNCVCFFLFHLAAAQAQHGQH